jgi:hypothetical protein
LPAEASGPYLPDLKLLELFSCALDDVGQRQKLDDLWENACRANEIADSVEISLKKRRAIELYDEEISEHSTFKVVMAAGGCLILLGILVAVPAIVFAEALIPGLAESAVWRNGIWAIVLMILAVFLGSQLLKRMAARPPSQET